MINKKIGKYEIIKLLGKGAMGVVYLGRDSAIDRLVAIKTIANLKDDFGDKKEVLQRFINEARSAGRLRHPNIITVFDANIDDGTAYIVMDFVQGKGLDEVLKEQGKIHPQNVLYYLKQLTSALDLAKDKGVLHRDIKPSNIMVDAQQHIFLLDFGVASLSDQLTTSKSVVGTPAYMSPEQIINDPLDFRSDLFSLGIVTFQLFSGIRPFEGNNFQEVLYNIVNSKPLSIVEQCDVPSTLDTFFAKALAKKREDRFSSGSEFFKELLKCFKLQRIDKPRDKISANWKEEVEDKVELEKGIDSKDFSSSKNTFGRFNNIPVKVDENRNVKLFILATIVLCICVLSYAVIKNLFKENKQSIKIQDDFKEADTKISLGDSDYLKFSSMTNQELFDYIIKSQDEAKQVEALNTVPSRKDFDIDILVKELKDQDSYLIKSHLIEIIFKTKSLNSAYYIKQLINDYDPIIRKKAIKASSDLLLTDNLGTIKLRKAKELNSDVLALIEIAISTLERD